MDEFCPSCGTKTVPGSVFCSACGGFLAPPGVDAGPAGFLSGQDFAVIAALMVLALLLILLLAVT